MFKGGVETLEFFSVEIAEYLESKGYEIFWYNLLLSKNSFNELMHYYNNHCNEQLYAITFNFEGLEGEEGLYNNDGWNFWDYSGVTVINIVVDHPLYYNQFLKALPEHYRQVNIDHMHIDYMKRFFPMLMYILSHLLEPSSINTESLLKSMITCQCANVQSM